MPAIDALPALVNVTVFSVVALVLPSVVLPVVLVRPFTHVVAPVSVTAFVELPRPTVLLATSGDVKLALPLTLNAGTDTAAVKDAMSLYVEGPLTVSCLVAATLTGLLNAALALITKGLLLVTVLPELMTRLLPSVVAPVTESEPPTVVFADVVSEVAAILVAVVPCRLVVPELVRPFCIVVTPFSNTVFDALDPRMVFPFAVISDRKVDAWPNDVVPEKMLLKKLLAPLTDKVFVVVSFATVRCCMLTLFNIRGVLGSLTNCLPAMDEFCTTVIPPLTRTSPEITKPPEKVASIALSDECNKVSAATSRPP